MILEEATKESFGYYASELIPRSAKLIFASCELCGAFRICQKHDYHTFCASCAKKGEMHPMFGMHLTDETKRKQRMMQKKKTGKTAPNWKGGKIKCICKQCMKAFFVYPCIIKNKKGYYCSRSCSIKAQRHNTKSVMTVPEKIFKAICIKYNLPFEFVGDGALWLSNANPDFIHKTKKIAVEIFGDYWHSPLLNYKVRNTATLTGRKKQLKAEGYKCIVLWESDLKRKDAEKFIMYKLKTENIL